MAKFKPGESGNSAGRPVGRTPGAKLKKIIAESMPDVLDAMIAQARSGDVAAGKVLMDKVIPSIKPHALPVQIAPGDSLAQSGHNIINSAMNGSVSPDVSALLLSAIANQALIVEITELEQRIIALEGVS